jgi:molybdopterin converting factor small subunit
MARVLFFGKLADLAGMREIDVPSALTLSQIKANLSVDNDPLGIALAHPTTRIALNLAILGHNEDPLIGTLDELAFMPPVSGG